MESRTLGAGLILLQTLGRTEVALNGSQAGAAVDNLFPPWLGPLLLRTWEMLRGGNEIQIF